MRDTHSATNAIRATPRRSVKRRLASLARRPPPDGAGIARLGRRYIYILPTGTGVLLAVVLVLMLLGSLNEQNNLALLFTLLMASMALVAMIHTWRNLLDLRIGATAGRPVFLGQEALFRVLVEDDRSRARGDLRLSIGSARTTPIQLPPDTGRTVDIAVPTVRRGWLTADDLRVETGYPLGLFRAWGYARTGPRVTVYPRPATRGPKPAPSPVGTDGNRGEPLSGADDFVGPRDYRPGDSPRRLDWKAFARHRGLVVKQFDAQRAARIWIDWDHLPAQEMELRIGTLCRQVLDAAEQGLQYGLRLPGGGVGMGQGETHKHRCLEALAHFGHD